MSLREYPQPDEDDVYGDELLADAMECSACGCTQDDACVTDDGPFTWAEPGLCTACADPFPNLRSAGFAY